MEMISIAVIVWTHVGALSRIVWKEGRMAKIRAP